MRSSTPALLSAPPSANPTGGSAARMRGLRRPGCARCSTPIRATRVTAYAGFDRTFSPRWQARLGLAGEASRITRNGITMDYQLVGIPLSILFNHANSDLNPTEGYRVDLDVTPWIYSRDFFTVIRLTGRHYFDISEDGRSVLATRASLSTEARGQHRRHPTRQVLLCRRRRLGARIRLSIRPACATTSTTRWAAPASSRPTSSSASASASRGAP